MKYASPQKERLASNFFDNLADARQLLPLFDSQPGLSFFVKDRQGRFVAMNRRGQEYAGVHTLEEVIGKTDHDFFPKQRADEYRADDLEVMKSQQPIVNRLESAPEPQGSPRLVVTSKIPLRDKRGRVVGVAGWSRLVDQLPDATETVDAFAAVIEHMHEHFVERLHVDQLAEMAGVSPSQFERRFRRAFGVSPHQYLTRIRVENATKLLATTDQSITDVSFECGFYDHAHLSRTFRRYMNCSPSEYRAHHQLSTR